MKIIGAILVICSSTAIGFYMSAMLLGRIRELRELKKDVFILRGDIQYGNTPLPEAMEAIARRSNGVFSQFFHTVSKQMERLSGKPLSVIWEKAIKEILKDSYLSKLDKEHLMKLGDNLGYLDQQMQIKTIDLYIEQLQLEIDTAVESKKEKTRIYNMLGILSGIFITIVLI
ncbi:stage III sporulation protein AB [Lachnospiraceae bacterium KM106-2]|nr:stage III sporulation protein AB [Lachnospiraceae bacterium KM106-2]